MGFERVAEKLKTLDFPLTSSLGGGWAGLLLLFSSLDGAELAERECVLKIRQEIEREGIADFSLFSGLAGICFALRHTQRYGKMVQKLDDYLVDKVRSKVLKNLSSPLKIEEYDPISGIAGIGIYLLQSQNFLVADILRHLTYSLNEKGWHLPQDYLFLEEERERYPQGVFNLGLSHGVTGILGFFAHAGLQGVEVAGQRELGRRIAEWLESKRRETHYWPPLIPLVGEHQGPIVDSWCYGAPGIARVLYLTGKWLGDKSMQERALDTFHSLIKRSNLENPAFCHGLSGLLMTTFMMAKDTGSIPLHKELRAIEDKIRAHYRPECPFGFEDGQPGLLEGAAGILLSLSTLSTNNSSWTLPFLI